MSDKEFCFADKLFTIVVTHNSNAAYVILVFRVRQQCLDPHDAVFGLYTHRVGKFSSLLLDW